MVKSVNRHLENYEFDQAALEAYDFFWKEFCAYYVEISKPILFGKAGTPEQRKNKQKLLVIVLCQVLRLIHPMAPFITEELFQHLKATVTLPPESADPYTQESMLALKAESCMIAPYPKVIREEDINPQIDETFAVMEEIVYTIRNIRGEMKLPPGTATDIHIVGDSKDHHFAIVQNNLNIISALVRTNQIQTHTSEPHMGFVSTGVFHHLKIMIPLPQEMLNQEVARLNKEKERLLGAVEKTRNQLSNQDFVSRAPAQLIEKHQQQLRQSEKELSEIETKLASIVG